MNKQRPPRTINHDGYVCILRPDHPRANYAGYVLEHILVAEAAAGFLLPPTVSIHHINEIRSDNRTSNLVICEDRGYHNTIHKRLRIVQAGGDPNTQAMCMVCKLVMDLSLFPPSAPRTGKNLTCRKCDAARYRNRASQRSAQSREKRVRQFGCTCGHGPKLHPFRRTIGRRTTCLKCDCAEYSKAGTLATLSTG